MTILKEAHPGKNTNITALGDEYSRQLVQVPVIMKGDNVSEILKSEIENNVQDGDIILIAESAVAAAEDRAIPIENIHPGFFANFLTKYMTKTDAGIGASDPLTMQVVIEEVGILRVLLGAFVAAITKPFGLQGMFYRVAGEQARGVDGPADYVIPPYNKYVVRAPKNPTKSAKEIENAFKEKIKVFILDANDLGVNVLNKVSKEDEKLGEALAADNPMGQSDESTPFTICRKV